MSKTIGLDSATIEGFTRRFLIQNYDEPVPTPGFHRDLWDLCCLSHRKVGIAAPRGHAKSTAITHAFVLACICFDIKDYVLVISDTESQAALFLGALKQEILENEELREYFGIKDTLVKDAVTDFIGEFKDGRQFRITAHGAGQSIRGRKWGSKRPNLVVIDDLENDEMVESDDRREKLRHWFYRALVPVLSKTGHIRMVGTILHLDSLLYRVLQNRTWESTLFKAHKSFDDFSELLWPDQWPEWRLREERQSYISEGQPEGYSQEYLNDPIDQSEAYFRKEDFMEMEDGDYYKPMNYYAGVDFAISDADRAAYTVFVIGGLAADGYLYIRDVLRYRSNDGDLHIRNMIAMQQKWNVDMWKAERGHIEQSLRGHLYATMMSTGVVLNIDHNTVPTKDKRSRARSIQGRMKAGMVKFDKRASWYPALEVELLQFPKGRYKDQVDALAWLGIAIAELATAPTSTELLEQQYEDELEQATLQIGVSDVTGY